ncbi:MAG: pitrilysin family protein [Elusimicrobiota bacterium]
MKTIKKALISSITILLIAGANVFGGTVNTFNLSNGIKVIQKEDSRNPLVTVHVFLRSGIANETEKQAGLSSFTQLLMIKGTKTRNAEKLGIEIEDIGASISSDVDYDFTSVGISLMSSYFGKGIELLSDIVFNPAFDKKEIEKERLNVLAGLKGRQDHIFEVANDEFNSRFYGNHPYSWNESGKSETVSAFKREDFVKWHGIYYVPGNIFMVIAGDVNQKTAKEFAEKYFGGIKNTGGFSPSAAPQVREPAPKKDVIATSKFQQAYYMIGFPAPALGQPDYATLKVINAMLGSRMSGRLFTELREKLSLAYEVNSFYPSRKQLSRFTVYLGLQKKNLKLAETRTMEILDDLRNSPVQEEELQDTKNYIKGIFLLDHQTISRQAWYLGWWEAMGMGYDYDEKYLQSLLSVSTADIQNTAKKYFNEKFVQIELVPEQQ